MVQTLNLVCDNSTLANFKSWAQAISSWFATAGWTKSSDTGQANWSTITTVPGQDAYVYEIWEPNDGLANFFFKIEYGNAMSPNSPALRLSLGTATNGAGVLTGMVMGTFVTIFNNSINPPSTTALYPCYFSGATGRLAVMMWRAAPNGVAQVFAVERSLNSSGAYTSAHVTLMLGGEAAFQQTWMGYTQQTLVFATGVAPAQSFQSTQPQGGLAVRGFNYGNGGSSDFAGSIPFDTTAPMIGYFDYPLTSFGFGNAANYTEGQIFSVSPIYGATRTFVATVSAPLSNFGPCCAHGALCMRYD